MKPRSRFGREVTGDFPAAADADFRVFKGSSGYTVVDADVPDEPLPGGADLQTERQVRGFLGRLLSGREV